MTFFLTTVSSASAQLNAAQAIKLINEKNDLQRRFNDLEQQFKNLQVAKKAADDVANDRQKEIATRTAETVKLQIDIRTLTKQVADLNVDLAKCHEIGRGLDATRQQKENLAKSHLADFNRVVREKQKMDAEHKDLEATIVAMKEQLAKASKAQDQYVEDVAKLKATISDYQELHTEDVQAVTKRNNELHACNAKLKAAQDDVTHFKAEIQKLQEQNPQRKWVLDWLKRRYPSTYGNEFNIEAMVAELGRKEQDPLPRPVAAKSHASGYLLLKMNGDIKVGGVAVPDNGELYQLVTVPMSGSPRSISIETSSTSDSVVLASGQILQINPDGSQASVPGVAIPF